MIKPESILSLDCSFSTGYAIWAEGKFQASGVVKFKDSSNPGMRYAQFTHFLDGVLDQRPFDVIAYENPHLRGFASTLALCGLVSRVIEAGAKRMIPVIGVHSSEIKATAGRGNAGKDFMIQRAEEEFPFYDRAKDPKGDEADALWLAQYTLENVVITP